MRRMNGRNPNFILVGLVVVIILLIYKCWLLSSENDDLSKDIQKLQAEIKLSAQKQEQYERTNEKLQGNIHDLDEKQQKLKTEVEADDQQLEVAANNIKVKEYEITNLKNQLLKKEESEKDLMRQIEDRDNKIEELVSDSQHILNLKNDAEEVLSEKDTMINNLKRELEQAKSVATEYEARLTHLKEELSQLKKELELKQKEDFAGAVNQPRGQLMIPKDKNSDPGHNLAPGGLSYVQRGAVRTRDIGLGGIKFYPNIPILPRDPPNAPRGKPRFSVADMAKEKKEPLNQIQQPDSNANLAARVKSGALIGEGAGGNSYNNVIPDPLVGEHPPLIPQADNLGNGVLEKPNNKPPVVAAPQEAAHPVLQQPNLESQDKNPIPQGGPYVQPGARNFVLQGLQPGQDNILMPPNNLQGNLDAAVDEEGKAMEDPADDQDEEGKEIKRDLEYYDKGEGNPHADEGDNESGGRHEPLGIGAKQELPPHLEGEDDLEGRKGKEDDVNLEDDVDHHANERVYEGNFDHKIRNLGSNKT